MKCLPISAPNMVFPMDEEYRIILQPEAYAGMEAAYEYIDQYSSENAHRWAVEIMDAINSLKTFPRRCGIAPENEFFVQEIRQLLHGKGRNVYRILFTIQDEAISILHIRHGAQDTLKPSSEVE